MEKDEIKKHRQEKCEKKQKNLIKTTTFVVVF